MDRLNHFPFIQPAVLHDGSQGLTPCIEMDITYQQNKHVITMVIGWCVCTAHCSVSLWCLVEGLSSTTNHSFPSATPVWPHVAGSGPISEPNLWPTMWLQTCVVPLVRCALSLVASCAWNMVGFRSRFLSGHEIMASDLHSRTCMFYKETCKVPEN